MNYKKICIDCADYKNGTCLASGGARCDTLQTCPYGITEEETTQAQNVKTLKHCESTGKKRKTTPKERKIDNEKLEILLEIDKILRERGYETTIENEIAVHFENFTIKMIRHSAKTMEKLAKKK